MQRSEIKLKSRYTHSDNRLVHIEGNRWKLKTDYNYRLIMYEDGSNIHSIDPEGGPMLSVGALVEGYRITKIYSNGEIEMENESDISCDRSV